MNKPTEFNFNLDDLAVIALPAAELAWLASIAAFTMANADLAAFDKSMQVDKESLRTAEGWLNYANDMQKISVLFLAIYKIYGGYPYIKKRFFGGRKSFPQDGRRSGHLFCYGNFSLNSCNEFSNVVYFAAVTIS